MYLYTLLVLRKEDAFLTCLFYLSGGHCVWLGQEFSPTSCPPRRQLGLAPPFQQHFGERAVQPHRSKGSLPFSRTAVANPLLTVSESQ